MKKLVYLSILIIVSMFAFAIAEEGSSCYSDSDCETPLFCESQVCVAPSRSGASSVGIGQQLVSSALPFQQSSQLAPNIGPRNGGGGEGAPGTVVSAQGKEEPNSKDVMDRPQLTCEDVTLETGIVGDEVTLNHYGPTFLEILGGTTSYSLEIFDGTIIVSGEKISVSDGTQSYTTDYLLIEPLMHPNYRISADIGGEMVAMRTVDVAHYGDPLFSIYSEDGTRVGFWSFDAGDRVRLLMDQDFFLIFRISQGKIGDLEVLCELSDSVFVQSQCADGLDNDNDGLVDSEGLCPDYPEASCGCDEDGDGSLDVEGGPYYCREGTFVCMGERGEVLADSCDTYQYEDPNCFYGDRTSESSEVAGSYGCLDANYGLMLADCQEQGGCSEDKIEGDLYEMDMGCQDTYEGGTIACVTYIDCPEGWSCDLDQGVCMGIAALVGEKNLQPCTSEDVCGLGKTCVENYCMDIASGGIDPSNPFLGWIEKSGETVTDLVLPDDAEREMRRTQERALENGQIDEKVEKGLLSSAKGLDLQAKNVERMGAATDRASVIIAANAEANPDAPGLQVALRRLNSATSTTNARLEQLEARTDASGPAAASLLAARTRTQNTADQVGAIENVPLGLQQGFGKGTLVDKKEEGFAFTKAGARKLDGQHGQGGSGENSVPDHVKKLQAQVAQGGAGASPVAKRLLQEGNLEAGQGASSRLGQGEGGTLGGEKERKLGDAQGSGKLGDSGDRSARLGQQGQAGGDAVTPRVSRLGAINEGSKEQGKKSGVNQQSDGKPSSQGEKKPQGQTGQAGAQNPPPQNPPPQNPPPQNPPPQDPPPQNPPIVGAVTAVKESGKTFFDYLFFFREE